MTQQQIKLLKTSFILSIMTWISIPVLLPLYPSRVLAILILYLGFFFSISFLGYLCIYIVSKILEKRNKHISGYKIFAIFIICVYLFQCALSFYSVYFSKNYDFDYTCYFLSLFIIPTTLFLFLLECIVYLRIVKQKKILLAICIPLVLSLFLPVPVQRNNEGSVGVKSVIYEVRKYQVLPTWYGYDPEWKDGVGISIFEKEIFYIGGCKNGFGIELFGKEVFCNSD